MVSTRAAGEGARPVKEAHKLRCASRSDASSELRRKVLGAAREALAALVEGREPVERDTQRTWTQRGSVWDAAALTALTLLINARLPALHCVAGGEFFTALKYAKGSLVYLACPAFNVLLFRSMPSNAPLPRTVAPSDQEAAGPASAVKVRVLESLADDEDTTQLAVRLLSQGNAQTHESDPLDRANHLRHELNAARGLWWHVVCDKQPLAAAGPWPASTRLTLQRGKYTYICFRHSELPRTMFTKLAVTDPNTQKLLFACVLAALFLTHHSVCSEPTSQWIAPTCTLVNTYAHYALAAVILLYVFARMLSVSKKIRKRL